MSHANISVFIPHEGCKNRCSFCNQRAITGRVKPDDVISAVMTAQRPSAEIAFFGGSFTLIERGYMLELLNTAAGLVKEGLAAGIRMSTRPDGIDDEIMTILKSYPVSTIELGAQSMCDDVLAKNLRGHDSECVRNASRKIKEYGISLGLQMMVGLYGSDRQKDIYTATELIAQKPDFVRIYPTIVIKNTMLCRLYEKGLYTPLSLEQAVSVSGQLLELFLDAGIPVIRLGLHEADDVVAGPFHPAFGEMAEGALMLKRAAGQLKEPGHYRLYVGRSFVSKMIGQHRKNIEILAQMGYNCKVYTADIEDYAVRAVKDV